MKLSDFKDEKAVEVVAKLLGPVSAIAKNQTIQNAKGKSVMEFAQALLSENVRAVMDILAILDDKDPATYHCTAATVLVDTMTMLTDQDMLQLFGLQRQTLASSGSASESTEAREA